MVRRVRREYVDEADDVVVDSRRPMLLNPVSTLLGLVLVALLVWAVVWGPIHEVFDGDGQGPKIDRPTTNR